MQKINMVRFIIIAAFIFILSFFGLGILHFMNKPKVISTPLIGTASTSKPKLPVNDQGRNKNQQEEQTLLQKENEKPVEAKIETKTEQPDKKEAPLPIIEVQKEQKIEQIKGLPYNNVAELSLMRAQLSKLKVQAEIEEQLARIRKLNSPELVLPSIPTSKQGKEVSLKLPDLDTEPVKTVVLSIFGIDGQMQAKVKTQAGRHITLKPGERFDGGTVSSITMDGVNIRQKNGTTKTLNFE